MQLKPTNLTPNTCTYLDLYISIYRGKYNFRSYDKRGDFTFDVINYPNLVSNIPNKPAYGVFMSQLVMFSRINCNSKYFKEDVKNVINKFHLQGFNKNVLLNKYKEFCKHYLAEWSKFGEDVSSFKFINELFK